MEIGKEGKTRKEDAKRKKSERHVTVKHVVGREAITRCLIGRSAWRSTTFMHCPARVGRTGLAMPKWFFNSARRWVLVSSDRKGHVDRAMMGSLPQDTEAVVYRGIFCEAAGRKEKDLSKWGWSGGKSVDCQHSDVDTGAHQGNASCRLL